MSRSARAAGFALAVLFLLLPLRHAEAQSPTDELRAHVNQILDLLRGGPTAQPGTRQDRRVAMRQAIEAVLYFPAMAERALGRYWAARTPEERTEFVRLFGDLVDSMYVAEIERHGEHAVAFLGESRVNDEATVETRIMGKSPTLVAYRMPCGTAGGACTTC